MHLLILSDWWFEGFDDPAYAAEGWTMGRDSFPHLLYSDEGLANMLAAIDSFLCYNSVDTEPIDDVPDAFDPVGNGNSTVTNNLTVDEDSLDNNYTVDNDTVDGYAVDGNTVNDC
ncbi:hypothetical protein NDU88_001863 [Pleurodeles waltl]|uniref:Uncharacterized protein n=1 Tax=Pleurodeles waltl TaxID=8319 RepID=A0AAV7QA16_PLEWA|nr:hypothetical protein NDU88_001863 [Pleurodeles waltl]